jgi:hypothetical protein
LRLAAGAVLGGAVAEAQAIDEETLAGKGEGRGTAIDRLLVGGRGRPDPMAAIPARISAAKAAASGTDPPGRRRSGW